MLFLGTRLREGKLCKKQEHRRNFQKNGTSRNDSRGKSELQYGRFSRQAPATPDLEHPSEFADRKPCPLLFGFDTKVQRGRLGKVGARCHVHQSAVDKMTLPLPRVPAFHKDIMPWVLWFRDCGL